jgi:pimeloyl-ACP methyl ester carboxylesterase
MPHTATSPRIYFETSGDASGVPLVLISGMGAQLIVWRDEFVQRLVDQGLFVIRLDNREVGLSDKTAEPDVLIADYEVDVFADDVCRVLDELGISSAHVAGESMGGAISQRMAIARPERVRSATLFYSAPGFDPSFLGDAIMQAVAAPAPRADIAREHAIALMVEVERLSASTEYPFDEAWIRRSKELYYDRGFRPDGAKRQASVILRSGDWREELNRINCPVAIIHGRADRLVNVHAALEMARLIPNAELHLYRGLGHQVAQELWDEFIPIMMRTMRRGRVHATGP